MFTFIPGMLVLGLGNWPWPWPVGLRNEGQVLGLGYIYARRLA